MTSPKLLTFRIELIDSDPVIWRTFQVPDNLMLDEFGDIIQLVMGWEDCHLQAFQTANPREIRMPSTNDRTWYDIFSIDEQDDGEPQEETTVAQAWELSNGSLYYQYDFGDNWAHRLSLIDAIELPEGLTEARVLDGALRAPVEDCGGIDGWYELLDDVRQHNRTEEQQDRVNWMQWRVGVNGTTDPLHFDREQLNKSLKARGLRTDWDTAFTRWMALRPQLRHQYALELAAEAEIGPVHAGVELPEWVLTRLVRPFAILVGLCEGKGIKLTQSGNLPTKIVGELVSILQWEGIDYSQDRATVEGNVASVGVLRESATEMRLVRKYHGRLTATKLGRQLAADPQQLAQHLLTHASLGKKSLLDMDQNFANWFSRAQGHESSSTDDRELKARIMNALGYANGHTGMPLTAQDYVFFSPLAGLLEDLATHAPGSWLNHFSPGTDPNHAQELAKLILQARVS